MELEEYVEKISTREDFLEFLAMLKLDYDANGGKWENNSLKIYLSGIEAYAKDVEGYYKNFNPGISADTPTWKIFAEILLGATVYE